MAIVVSEKVFDRVQKAICWAVRKTCSLRRDCEPCSGNVRECAELFMDW